MMGAATLPWGHVAKKPIIPSLQHSSIPIVRESALVRRFVIGLDEPEVSRGDARKEEGLFSRIG
jgi:hypothetical protein